MRYGHARWAARHAVNITTYLVAISITHVPNVDEQISRNTACQVMVGHHVQHLLCFGCGYTTRLGLAVGRVCLPSILRMDGKIKKLPPGLSGTIWGCMKVVRDQSPVKIIDS